MNQHDMTELVLTASDARDFPDYRQVLARVLLELDARMTTLEVVVNASAKNTGEGRAEEARSGSVTGPSKQPVQARPTGVREDVSVVDEGPVASRQAAPSPASPSPDAVEALARELQRAHHDGAWSDVPLWTASETSQRGYLAEARYVLSRYEPRGASVCEWCGHPWIEHSDEIGCRHPDGDGYCECLQFEPTPSPRGSTASDKLCAYCAIEVLTLRAAELEKRVSELESATKNTGEGSTSQTGAVSHSQSGGGSDGTREPARSACIDDAGTTQDTPSPASSVPAPATGKVPEWVGVLAKLNDAHEIVCKVASDRREWRMSIPVRDTDTDMMLSDAINAAENCIRRLIASRAPAAPSVEEITRIVRDADQDFEGSGGSTRHWVRDCFLPALEKSGLRIVGAPAPASAQGEVCECGHIAAIHDDPHGDGAHGGSCLEIIGKCSDGSDDFCCCSEFHHAQ